MATEGVEPNYVRAEILPEFFRSFWVRRMALDRRNYRALVETTVELANKVVCSCYCLAACMGYICALLKMVRDEGLAILTRK